MSILQSSETKVFDINNYKFNNKVDDYEKIKVLGKGGFSIVNLVKYKENGKLYAMKCVNKIRNGKNKIKKIHREIYSLLKLNHPNIIHLYGWFEDSKKIYLIFEHIRGSDLSTFFEKDLPTEQDAIYIIKQILHAVKYCHENNIIHRDIKLGNILIDSNLHVTLIDFGLCAIKHHHDELFFEYAGTARFTAPDILNGKGYNEAVDLWSIGITVYYILTKSYPFNGHNRKEIFKQIKNYPVDYPDSLNFNQIDFIKKLLYKNSHKRFNIHQALQHHWINQCICFCYQCTLKRSFK